MTERDILTILNRFCAKEKAGRFDMRKPFRIGEYVYATDGRCGARAKIPGEYPCDCPPPADKVFLASECFEQSPAEMPILPEPLMCEMCDGNGTTTCGCECGGCSHDIECNHCFGGFVSRPVSVGGVVLVGEFYARPLMEFGARFYPHADSEKRRSVMVRWVAGDVEGVLMPVMLYNGNEHRVIGKPVPKKEKD